MELKSLVLATVYLVNSVTVVMPYKNCPYAPVCATNGETYSNACDFRIAQIEDSDLQVLFDGNCKNYVVLNNVLPRKKQKGTVNPSLESANSQKPRISLGKSYRHVKLKYKKKKQKKIDKTDSPWRKPELGWSSITRKRP